MSRTVRLSARLLTVLGALVMAIAAVLPPSPWAVWLTLAGAGGWMVLLPRRAWSAAGLVAAWVACGFLVVAASGTLPLRLGLGMSGVAGVLCALALAVLAARVAQGRVAVVLPLGFRRLVPSMLVVAVVLAGILVVDARNGPTRDGDGRMVTYDARLWYARDTFYLLSFAQAGIAQDVLPEGIPFVHGVLNQRTSGFEQYPTTMAHGLGLLARRLESRVAADALARIAPVWLLTVVLLLLEAAIRLSPSGRGWWAGPLAVSVAVLLRPDLFVYPTMQSLAFPLLFLGWVIVGRFGRRVLDAQVLTWLSGLLVLACLSHLVTASAIVGTIVACAVVSLRDAPRERAMRLVKVALGLLLLYVWVTKVRYPPVADYAPDRERLAQLWAYVVPWLAVMGVLGACAAAKRRQAPTVMALALGAGCGVLWIGGLAFVDAFDRAFQWFNAERFMHLALVPAMAALSGAQPRLAGAAGLGVACWFAVAPVPTAVLTPRLVTESPIHLTRDHLDAFEVVAEGGTDRFLVAVTSHYGVSAFTGRTIAPLEDARLWVHGMDRPDRIRQTVAGYRSRYRDPVVEGGIGAARAGTRGIFSHEMYIDEGVHFDPGEPEVLFARPPVFVAVFPPDPKRRRR